MMTLLSSLLGFVSALFPDFLKFFRDIHDRKHELAILKLQIEQQRLGHTNRLEEIRIEADSVETQALYSTYHNSVSWVEALNGTVRPVIAYALFLLYAGLKYSHLHHHMHWLLWTEEDQVIFASVISFYFGQRAFAKYRYDHK